MPKHWWGHEHDFDDWTIRKEYEVTFLAYASFVTIQERKCKECQYVQRDKQTINL